MAKQLIVVVHGVGVKQAGQSSDLLATALERPPEETAKLSRAEIVRMQTEGTWLRPHSTDDFELRELGTYNVDDKRRTFPARIRRYRQYGPNDQVRNERVIADFYWGDISKFGPGVVSLLVALVKTILGIGHTVRENAQSVFGKYTFAAKMADGVVRLIHGPIAAFNAVMIAGAATYWGFRKAADLEAADADTWFTNCAGALVAAAAIGGGVLLYRSEKSFLGRELGHWLVIAGLVLALSESSIWSGTPPWLEKVDASAASYVCRTPVPQPAPEVGNLCKSVANSCAGLKPQCRTALKSGIYVSGGRLLAIASVFWFAALVLNVLFVPAAIMGARRNGKQGDSASAALLAPVATSGMLFLWMLFLMTVWATTAATGWELLPHPDMLNSGLVLAAAVSLVIALMLLAGLAIAIAKWIWSRLRRGVPSETLTKLYFKGDKQLMAGALRHRLIVADGFAAVFLIGGIILASAAIAVFLAVLGFGNGFLVARLAEHAGKAVLFIGLIGVAVFAWFRPGLQLSLEILTDVITYINDYDWRWEKDKPGRTVFERIAARGRNKPEYGKTASTKEAGYWPRERIKNRLKVLVDELIANERPNHLAIVSHSQGTVIALDVLDEAGPDWCARLDPSGGEPTVRLVTMGSPYTHIHGHYFPKSFPPVAQRQNLARGKVLSDWINIFRVDDFVGTHVDPEGIWPREHPVPPNGHTMYWTDENVFPLLRKFLEIDQPEREAARPKAARGRPAREGRARGRVKRR